MAREIEGTTSSHLAAELENGDDDEENAFSAVVRDPNQSKPSSFVTNYAIRFALCEMKLKVQFLLKNSCAL